MATQNATAHPLEPLAPAELERAAELVRATLPGGRFVSLGLHEPPKAAYLAWLDGAARPPRCALAIAVDRERRVHELVCDLDAGAVISRQVVDGARSPITPEDYEAAVDAVRADAGLARGAGASRCRRRLARADRRARIGGFELEVERGAGRPRGGVPAPARVRDTATPIRSRA